MENKEVLINIISIYPPEKAAGIISKHFIPKLEHFDKQIKLIEDSVKVINQLTKQINEVK